MRLPPAKVRSTEKLVEAFLAGRTATTVRAYGQDLRDFAAFSGASDAEVASRHLLTLTQGEANGLVLAYRAHLLDRGLSGATVNRRLAALRALVKLARTLGLVTWALEVPSIRVERGRDLRGPGRASLKRVLGGLQARQDAKGKRDLALLRLIHDLGLRRGEAASLDLEHLDLAAGTVAVLGKGRQVREALTLPQETTAALRTWLEARGPVPGALFTNFDNARKGKRLTGSSIYRLTVGLGLGRPHGLRHAAITEALDLMAGDLRKVQRFSRHRDVRMLAVYDDCRLDLGGEVSRAVAANL